MSKTMDLGPVSAYALAVKYGYDGTEAEWVAEMESKRLEASASAASAASSATDASESETAAGNSAASAGASATAALGSATEAESYAHGGTGTRTGEDTDNARYYMEQAKAVSAVEIATTGKAGIVRPDGDTITVDAKGVISADIDKTLLDKLGESDDGNLTFDGKEIKAAQMTGASAGANGTSGTVPAPKAGQQNLFLRGDGTWAESGGYIVFPEFTVDFTTGHLSATGGAGVEFSINAAGHLESEVL